MNTPGRGHTVRPLKRHELPAATRVKVAVTAEAWAPHLFWLRRHIDRRTREAEARSVLPLWRSSGQIFGAFEGRDLIGVSRAIVGRYREVSDLWVIAGSRQRGVGSALFAVAEAALRKQGVRTARLYTAAFNRDAIAFYRGRGWRIERRNMHRVAHIRRVRMIKRLR